MNRKSTIESLVLGILIIVVGGYIAVSSGFISLQVPSVDTNTSQYKQQQTSQQQEQQTTKETQYFGTVESEKQPKKPLTSIKNETINWDFSDSKGNPYHWEMPIQTYDDLIKQPLSGNYLNLRLPTGTTIKELDYTAFVGHHFSKVIDQVYDNAGSDDQFVYEVWYVVSQMTTYSLDITNSNLSPLEVMTRAGGDCKDLSILIADMIRSSSHTKDWKVKLVYLDYYNPTDPQTIDHMIVEVDTGNHKYDIEATAKNNGLHVWDGTNIFGWRYDV